jgi:hypothetical protein
MFKIILLLIVLWLAVRLVWRLTGLTTIVSRNDRTTGRNTSSFSASDRQGKAEEADFEVIDTRIRHDD